MSVGYDRERGVWNADCIFCDWTADFPSMTAADRGNDRHLMVGCEGLDRDERQLVRKWAADDRADTEG